MKNTSTDKFNYLILVLALSLIISVFARFTDALGIQAALFFLLGITVFFNFNAYKVKLNYYILPLLLFISAAVAAYYNADFQFNARNGIMLLSYCSAAYLLAGFLKPNDKRSVLLIPVLLGLWLTIFLFASNTAFSNHLSSGILSRETRAIAGFLILALSLSFVFWWTERKIYMYTSFIILVAVALTKVYFAVALACLMFGVFLFFMRERVKVKTSMAVLPFMIISAAAFFHSFKNGYFSSKIELWRAAAAIIKDNFVSGVGFANYSTVANAYATMPGIDFSRPDNIFLQLLAETGIIGFLLFASVLAVFFIFIIRKLKNKEDRVIYLPVMLAVIFFIAYNLFESSAFISTNMLVLFILLSFPLDGYDIKIRDRQINTYIAVLLVIPLFYTLALPIMALKSYKDATMFFASGRYVSAKDFYIDAMNKDFLNPAYASGLSDTYFAMSRKGENPYVNLNHAIEYKKFASRLNRYNGKYYYDLAWLFKHRGDMELALENITKALEMDPFNRQFLDFYGELIY